MTAGEIDKIRQSQQQQQRQPTKKPMFIVISDVELMNGVEEKFKQWFLGSNQILSRMDGFITRMLLKSSSPSSPSTSSHFNYRIVFITENKESFEKIHKSREHGRLHGEAMSFMARPPARQFYEVLTAS
jgi:heme-degrading monooxygenase HmoA